MSRRLSSMPFHADAILDDGRLVRHCRHKIPHTVGHLDPKLLVWPSVTQHECDGCCGGYELMQEDHEWPTRKSATGAEAHAHADATSG